MTDERFNQIMYCIIDARNIIIYNLDRQRKLLPFGKAILKQYELEANSGNELIFKEYSELKELVLKLNDMDKM